MEDLNRFVAIGNRNRVVSAEDRKEFVAILMRIREGISTDEDVQRLHQICRPKVFVQ